MFTAVRSRMSTSQVIVTPVVSLALLVVGLPSILCHPMSNVVVKSAGDGLCADMTSDELGCGQFYSCASHRLNCRNIRLSVASQLCHRLESQHSHHQVNQDVLRWAQRINRCVVRRLSHHLASDDVANSGSSPMTCAENDRRARSAMQWCAHQDEHLDEACRAVLGDGRQTALSLFGNRNWLWLVETMRSCPRHAMNRFIKWAIVVATSTGQ